MDDIREMAASALESQPVKRIYESGYRPNDSYEQGLDESDIEQAFDSLSNRQRMIGSLIQRVNSQRGMPPLESGDLLIRISDCQHVLEDIPEYALEFSFTRAMKLHDYKQPFQMSEVATIWREMSESTRQELYEKSGIKALPQGLCEWCNNTGFMRVKIRDNEFTPVVWASLEDTNTMMKCDCRKAA